MITNLKHGDKYNKKEKLNTSLFYSNENYSNFIVRGSL